jgi:hypothetical protein
MLTNHFNFHTSALHEIFVKSVAAAASFVASLRSGKEETARMCVYIFIYGKVGKISDINTWKK